MLAERSDEIVIPLLAVRRRSFHGRARLRARSDEDCVDAPRRTRRAPQMK